MKPFYILIDNSVEIPPKIQTREAVRALIIHQNQVLLMFSERDHMFGTPGGGITLNESKLDTLYRELLEEVGAKQIRVVESLGQTEEIRESRSMKQPVKIISDYYHVEVLEYIHESLAEHEEEMGLKPMFVSLDQAIQNNEQILQEKNFEKLNFYHTQTAILKYIKQRFGL